MGSRPSVRCLVAWSTSTARRLALVVALVCLPAFAAAAQAGTGLLADTLRRNVQFNQLTAADGLSHEMVYDFAQDARGFIWIATQEGLNRYDGYTVRTYEHLRTDPTTLSHDFIRALLIDAKGDLWVGTEVGVNRYDQATDAFDRQPFAATAIASDRGLEYSVRTMIQTRDGAYWIGTAGGGLIRVSEDLARTERFRHDTEDLESLPDDTVLALLEDRIGNLWVGTQTAGLVRYDPVVNGFVRPNAAFGDAEHDEVRSLFEDRSGVIWIGTGTSGVGRFDPRRGTFDLRRNDPEDPGSLPNDRIRDVHEDSRGTVWVASDDGLAEWRSASGQFVTYRHADEDARSLGSDRVNTLFVDGSGVLWVGSWAGVSRWNYVSDTFTYFSTSDGRLPGDLVTSVAESRDGTLWTGTYGGGLGRLDPITGATEFYRNDPADPDSLPDNRVMVVHVDPSDQVWLGTRSAGLARLDVDSGRFTVYRHDPEQPTSLSGDAVTSIVSDSEGMLWVGTFGAGLNRLAPDIDGRFARFRTDPNSVASLSGDRVISLFPDDEDKLWVGTEGAGLNRIDLMDGTITRLREFRSRQTTDAGPTTLQLGSVTDLRRDQFGSLWIGTLGQGLLRWSTDDIRAGVSRVDIFDKAQGLSTDTIYGILEGEQGAIWFSSNRGLTRFDADSGSLRQFDVRNGLKNSEFNQGARARARSGRLLFGGTTGLVGFFPGDLPSNSAAPGIVVTARNREQELLTVGLDEPVATVSVGYPDPFLAFDFVALDFVSPDKNQYRYRLEGFDPGWIEADQIRRATYTNLPPGDFRFSVQAANNDGVWTDGFAAVDVTVVPPPWSTWWAYLSYGVLAVVLLMFVARSQRRKLAQETAQRAYLEQEVAVRTRELADRNNELEDLNGRLAEAAVTDSLTGLRNRRYADQFIASDIAQFEREQADADRNGARRDDDENGRSMFFMMIDLDGFKTINDEHGHAAGDQALIQITELLKRACRTSDSIIRWGGDEFLVVGTTTSYVKVKLLAERIRESVALHRFDVGNDNVGRLSASIGIAPYPFVEGRYGFSSWESVTAVADQAAYISKASGRNCWVSIAGTETFRGVMLPNLGANLERLQDEGHIVIDTSRRYPLTLAPDVADASVRGLATPAPDTEPED